MVRHRNNHIPCRRKVLRTTAPDLRAPGKQAHAHRDDPTTPLDSVLSEQGPTNRGRPRRKLHQSAHLGKLQRGPPIISRHRPRLRPGRRDRMHRPRPLHHQWATYRSRSSRRPDTPGQLDRSVTLRNRPPHMGNRARSGRN